MNFRFRTGWKCAHLHLDSYINVNVHIHHSDQGVGNFQLLRNSFIYQHYIYSLKTVFNVFLSISLMLHCAWTLCTRLTEHIVGGGLSVISIDFIRTVCASLKVK